MTEAIAFNSKTPKLGLPNLFPGQAQKEFFVNEAHGILDGLLHATIEGTQSVPPVAPDVSDCWIVGSSAAEEWAGHEGKLVVWNEGGWSFIEPSGGMLVFDKSSQQFVRYNGGWASAAEPTDPQGGSVIDAEARMAIRELVAALRTFGVFSSL